MKKMMFYALLSFIPTVAFAALLDSSETFANNAKALSQCMQEKDENCGEILDNVLHFTGELARGIFGVHDQGSRVEVLFAQYRCKMTADDFGHMVVHVLEKAFSERPSDGGRSKFKRQMRMTFMPHEEHLAYVVNKANQILQSSESIIFKRRVRTLADSYLKGDMR